MKLIALTLSTLLAGCTTFIEHNSRKPFPNPTEKIISIHQLHGGNLNVLGYAEISTTHCKIYLRNYPQCLLHEIRHCFEGNWHKGIETDKDC